MQPLLFGRIFGQVVNSGEGTLLIAGEGNHLLLKDDIVIGNLAKREHRRRDDEDGGREDRGIYEPGPVRLCQAGIIEIAYRNTAEQTADVRGIVDGAFEP